MCGGITYICLPFPYSTCVEFEQPQQRIEVWSITKMADNIDSGDAVDLAFSKIERKRKKERAQKECFRRKQDDLRKCLDLEDQREVGSELLTMRMKTKAQLSSRVSAAFVGRFRFSHLRLRNQTEEREVKVFRCGVALSSAYYLIFLKISFLVSYLHQFLPAIIVASFIAL